MEALIAQIAESYGYPAEMVERSAAARATAMGLTTEQVLQQWAGGEALAAAPAAAPAASTPASAPAAAETAAPATSPEPEASGPEVEVLAPAAGAGEEADGEDEDSAVEEAPPETAERRVPRGTLLSGFPRWLAAAFVIIPTIAFFYLLIAPDGPDCGVSGQLAIDPVTGVAENCDGTEYGVDVVNFFAQGEELYELRCAACHGSDGGGGAGQVLSGGAVLASFPTGQCLDHIAWVELATANWPDPTYGALAKPVGGFGQMPGFEGVLTPEEIASVVLYERVAFGGEALPDAEADCGLGHDAEVSAAP